MTRAAIYARIACHHPRDGAIDRQVRACRKRAEKEGWTVVKTYTDYGSSGMTMIRPGLQALMQDATAGKFDIVLAEALDRLSRDQEDVAGIFKRLSFCEIKIVTLGEPGAVLEMYAQVKKYEQSLDGSGGKEGSA